MNIKMSTYDEYWTMNIIIEELIYIGTSTAFVWPNWYLTIILCVCVFVCVYVYVFIFFHREGFFRLQDVQDILERYGSTILCCEYSFGCFCQVPSSLFPNLSYFTSKDVTPARRKTGDNTIWYTGSCEKMICMDIGYKTATCQAVNLRKDTKDKEAILI